MPNTGRDDALRNLESGQTALEALYARLDNAQMERVAALGGGSWTVKDLIGHMAAWEELALQTLDAWRAGRALATEGEWVGTDAFNARVQERISEQSLSAVRRHATETHIALLRATRSVDDL